MEIRPLGQKDAAPYWNLRLESLQTDRFAFGKAAEEYQARKVEVTADRFRNTSYDIFTLGAFDGDQLIGTATFIREAGFNECHKGRIHGVYERIPKSSKFFSPWRSGKKPPSTLSKIRFRSIRY